MIRLLICKIRGHVWIEDLKQSWRDEGGNDRWIKYERCARCRTRVRRTTDYVTKMDEMMSDPLYQKTADELYRDFLEVSGLKNPPEIHGRARSLEELRAPHPTTVVFDPKFIPKRRKRWRLP